MDSSKPNVRAVLTWLNDGVFTLNNGTLSVDWDLEVLDSNFNVIATSASHVDPFESIDFTITSSGVYSFRLTRFALINPAINTEIGLAVNWDD